MKIRLLHVFVTLPVGGAENLLISILKGLDPERFESTVCTLGPAGELSAAVVALGIPFIELKVLRRGTRSREIVAALREVIRTQHIDLVHSHLYHANFYSRLAARTLEVPCVISVHNTYNYQKLHRRLINWWLGRRHTAALIAGSEEIKRDVLKYDRVPPRLLEIIPNSVDLSRSLPSRPAAEIRVELAIPAGTYILGTIGRLEIQKGHRMLIDAVHLLRGHFPVLLLLIGAGREEAALRRQVADLGLDEQVKFLGTRSDLGDLFSVVDLFVMPSLWEGLSLAMLSAMAAGLPVVATRVGGVEGVLGADERGWIVPPNDFDALAEAIRYCHDHPAESARKAAAGQLHTQANYSDAAMVRRVEAVYQRVLAKGC